MKFGLKLQEVHLSSFLVSFILAALLIPLAGVTKIEPHWELSLKLVVQVGSYCLNSDVQNRLRASLLDNQPASVQITTNSRVNLGVNPVVLASIATDQQTFTQTATLKTQNTFQKLDRSHGWIRYKSKTGQFQILLPTVPDKQAQTQIVMGTPLKITTELSQLEGVSYLIVYTDYPDTLLKQLADLHTDWQFFLLETVKDKFLETLETIEGDLITQTYFNSLSNLGKQVPVSLEIQFQLGQTQQGISRWILVKDRLYQLIILSPLNPLQPLPLRPSTQNFLDSFQPIY